jgi:hypothetical protein
MRKQNSDFIRIKIAFSVLAIYILNILLAIPFPSYAQHDFNELVKQVQLKAQHTYDEINSASFKGHSKTYIYFGANPLETNLVPVKNESYFDGFWMRPDSSRIVIKALHEVKPGNKSLLQIGAIEPLPNPFQFINDYATIVKITDEGNNKWPLYPFALGADSCYLYSKMYEIGFGDNEVLAVSIKPKKANVPAVIGTFQIDKNRKVVVASDVIFNDAASFTKPGLKHQKNSLYLSVVGSKNHKIKTKHDLFYHSYWLPQSIEEEFEFGMLGFNFHVYRLIEFDSYVVNPEIPDSSTIINKKFLYDPDPELEKKLFVQSEYPDRLSKEEEDKIITEIENDFHSKDLFYDLMNSKSIAQDAVKMIMGQRIGRYYGFAQQLGNYVQYNRVEGLSLNYGINLSNLFLNNSIISLSGGYGFKDKRWKADAAMLQYLGNQKKVFIEGNLYNATGFEEDRRIITTGKNTFTSLLYKGDYRDYYYKMGGNIGIGYRATDNLAMKLSIVSQTEKIAATNTKFSLFKHKKTFRTNPEIAEGEFRGLRASILYRTSDLKVNINAEYTDKSNLRSDFSYAFIKADLLQKFRPTYHSFVNIFASGGISSGYLIPQRWFDFGGKTFMNYHGNLRCVDYKAFTGDRMASAIFEYSINGSALSDRGIGSDFIRTFKLSLWSGAGWSSLSYKSKNLVAGLDTPLATTDGLYHEFGIGIGDVANIFRIDFARNNIDKNKIQISFNVLR